MEYEKIKIYVTKRVAGILQKDAEIFEFIKKDGITPNKNAFLSALITNYWQQYREQQTELNNMIKKILKDDTVLPEHKITDLSNKIVAKINKENASDMLDKFDSIVSFKPTVNTQPIIDYIDEYLLFGFTLSEYFRNMFTSYAALSQDMREEIIFKSQYNTLSEAIKKGKKVYVTIKDKAKHSLELSPYAFARSKEEIHIYLLAKHGTACKNIKLSKIQSAVVLDKKTNFQEQDIQLFKRMIEYGPQFLYQYGEQDIVVRLTQRGRQLFHKIYVHRPIPYEVTGDTMVFKCSYAQIIQYFSRFGGDVEIISPLEIKQAIFGFHNSYVKKNALQPN